MEGNYLEETREFGNIFHGWNALTSFERVKIRKSFTNDERLFSLSSISSPASKREDSKKVIILLLSLIVAEIFQYLQSVKDDANEHSSVRKRYRPRTSTSEENVDGDVENNLTDIAVEAN